MLRFPRASHLVVVLTAALAPHAAAQWVIANHNDLLGVDDAEFTPDGRYLVVRDNTISTTALVYDAATGVPVFQYGAQIGSISGICQDAVGVTDDRAIVIGSSAMVIDLNSLSVVAEHNVGTYPRDVMVTPDGTLAVVRGGNGMYVIDLGSGAIVAQAPGLPSTYLGSNGFDVDSVVADDEHAVFVGEVSPGGGVMARVTIFDLHPAGGGAPQVVFETTAANDQEGKAHDVAMMPDGTHAVVRSDMEVGLYKLDGNQTTQVWVNRLKGDPGPFGGSALDSIEATDHRIATISRRDNAGTGAQLDVFDRAGTQKFAYLVGDPHDLALTPDGEHVITRTHTRIYLFDIRNLPSGGFLIPLDEDQFLGTNTSWGSGLDSVVATNEHVAAMSRTGGFTRVRTWDITADTLEKTYGVKYPDRALDLALSPDGNRVIFGFVTSLLLVDLRMGVALLEHKGTFKNGSYPWCDGVAIDGEHAAAFGIGQVNGEGWLSIVDLFEQPVRFCDTNPNSTGEAGELVVTGTPSVGSNDLVLWGSSVPAGEFGQFFYGDQMTQVPFGDGYVCLAGQVARFSVVQASDAGVVSFPVDNTNLPPNGGAILPGTTWGFQLVYRDGQSQTAAFNLTDAISIAFEN